MEQERQLCVVVTGATSFLGAALIKEMVRRGYRVYGVARPGSSNRKVLDGLPVKIIEMELGELDRIRDEIQEPCHIFFHFGWDGSGSGNRRKTAVQQKNAEDGIKALRGARSLGCRRFVFSGSQAEYGIRSAATREDMECRPVSEYGKAKVEFGRRARSLCGMWRQQGEWEMEYVHVRIFSVYGPGDHPWSLVNSCLDTFLSGGEMELGACTQLWNFLYIEDLVKGLLSLALSALLPEDDGIYNLAGDEDSTMALKSYVEQMYELCGRQGSRVYGKLPPNAEGPANLIPDIGKIKRQTGWRPEISFEEGINRMIDMKHEETRRHNCILCGQGLEGARLMELANMPASAQDIPGAGEVERDRGITLRLYQCPGCGLVQFDCRPVAYYRDVIRSGGYTTTMEELRTGQYRHLIETYGLEGKKFLEVGCGQGEFLNMLTKFPVKAFGVEHRKALAEKAAGLGLSVTEGFTETADTVLGNDGPYDVFLSFNFLEHQPEPGVMLDCIRNNLTDGGMGLITVPSLEYILAHDGYYELIRDHIAYYTFGTLRYLLESHGFQVLEEEVVNRDTLSVIVRRMPEGGRADGGAASESREAERGGAAAESREAERGGAASESREAERGGAAAESHEAERGGAAAESREQEGATGLGRKPPAVDVSGLRASLKDIPEEIEKLCRELAGQGRTLAMWGAGHQGFTLAATTALKEYARYILDSAPFKQGRFAPASHLPIVAPEEYEKDPVDVILIAAPGYTQEIAQVIRRRYGGRVKIMALRSDHVEELS